MRAKVFGLARCWFGTPFSAVSRPNLKFLNREWTVNNFYLPPQKSMGKLKCATNNSSSKYRFSRSLYRGVDCSMSNDPLRRIGQSHLSARRAFTFLVFFFKLVRMPGFAPGPSPSQGEMLLITPRSWSILIWYPWPDSHRLGSAWRAGCAAALHSPTRT